MGIRLDAVTALMEERGIKAEDISEVIAWEMAKAESC